MTGAGELLGMNDGDAEGATVATISLGFIAQEYRSGAPATIAESGMYGKDVVTADITPLPTFVKSIAYSIRLEYNASQTLGRAQE